MIQKKHEWIIEELKILRDMGLIERPRVRGSKGYANFPIKWSIEGNFKDYGIKENGIPYRAFASYKAGPGMSGIVFIDMEIRKKVHDLLLKKTLENPSYVTYRKEMTDKCLKILVELSSKKLSKESISKATKKDLMDYYNKFRDIYTRYELYNSIWFIISDDVAKMVVERLQKQGCNDFNDIQTILTPTIPSFINRESIDMIKVAIKISENVHDKSLFLEDNFESFSKTENFSLIQNLVKEYHWIPFGHVGPQLFDEKHYFAEIKKILLEDKDLKMELEKAENFYPNIIKNQKSLFNQFNIDTETQRLVKDLHILSQFQDERKEYVAKTHMNWVHNLMSKIGEYFGLSGREAADLYPEIIEKCLLHDIVDKKMYDAEQTGETFFEITESDGYSVYLDKEADPFLDIIRSEKFSDELKGECACAGKVTGRVKILHSSDEVYKVEKGDILVTSMTTPDFVPAMRKAAAIITDEGGVTCHAAIVSRELGIPCIINTKRAMQVLKENEMIEMDAELGTIKRLNVTSENTKQMEKLPMSFSETNIVLKTDLNHNFDFVRWFSEIKDTDINLVGGKALNLGKMFKTFPIPDGFCLTTNLFKKYIDTEKITNAIRELNLDNIAAVNNFSEDVKKQILKIEFTQDDKKIIIENFEKLGAEFVAVRSSGSAEDLPGAAFAGQHDTYLNIKKVEIFDKILSCFASVYSPRAIYYRDMKDINSDVALAVVIQKMVDSKKSGVMYTKNPTSGENEVIIEVAHGLGEMVVSGRIEPDRVIITDTVNYKIGSKQEMLTMKGVEKNKKNKERCLDFDEIDELFRRAKDIEEYFDSPQDIEFAYDDKLYIVQSRDLTTIRKR